MNIKLLTPLKTDKGVVPVGQVVALDDAEAEELIAVKAAEKSADKPTWSPPKGAAKD